jgi:predicted permease
VSLALICAWLITRLVNWHKPVIGALLLAAAFPNVTYLGLPILMQTFGDWAQFVVIQLDLFATAPFLFTVGMLIARHYGEDNTPQPLWKSLNAPPFWTAGVAVLLNTQGVITPDWLNAVLEKLASAAAPLMIFSLGLALNWQSLHIRQVPYVLPIVIIKLFLMPLCAMLIVEQLTLAQPQQAAAVMDMAMPSMLLGIVFCDRFRLDSSLYAMAVTVTTLLSLISLPFWHTLLTQEPSLGAWLTNIYSALVEGHGSTHAP